MKRSKSKASASKGKQDNSYNCKHETLGPMFCEHCGGVLWAECKVCGQLVFKWSYLGKFKVCPKAGYHV